MAKTVVQKIVPTRLQIFDHETYGNYTKTSKINLNQP